MKDVACEELLDRLPDWAAGRLPEAEAAGVAAHVQRCAGCAGEVAVLEALLTSGPPPVPAGLAEQIVRAARRPVAEDALPSTGRSRWISWALPAAAVLALALGTTLFQGRNGNDAASRLGEFPVEEGTGVWTADEGAVAGAPLLEGLSDEALAMLLEELGG